MSFEIFTDSASNLGGGLAREHNIQVISLPYFLDGKEQPLLDADTFDAADYYGKLKAGAVVTTSQINPQRYMEILTPCLQAGKDILFVGMAGGISGSYASARIAAEELMHDFPGRKVRTVDSLGASLGEGLLVLEAAECREKGMGLEQTAAYLETRRMQMYQIFIADDLRHLHRTGRISNASAIIGSVLGIRPLLKGSAEGTIVAFGKIRGKRQAIRAMAEKFIALGRETDRIGISNCACPEDVEFLIQLLEPHIPRDHILCVNHEPATGSHLGPGSLALFFYGDEDVRQF